MTDYLSRACPVCGGLLWIDTQYPDEVHCATCEYPNIKMGGGWVSDRVCEHSGTVGHWAVNVRKP